ncbi:MAG: c-type cytochrome [Chitinophagaceae bacterium]
MKIYNRLFFLMVMMMFGYSCNTDHRTPRDSYISDMASSIPYQTNTGKNFYREKIGDNRPVGTIAVNQDLDLLNFPYPNTIEGYNASMKAVSPIPKLTGVEKKEAERLYMIYCGICHGTKLDGNGPLYNDGNGPYIAKPAALVGDFAPIGAKYAGSIYFAILYGGRSIMGSHASQLTPQQSWMIVDYIKAKQQ